MTIELRGEIEEENLGKPNLYKRKTPIKIF